jgi:hypothetical protein
MPFLLKIEIIHLEIKKYNAPVINPKYITEDIFSVSCFEYIKSNGFQIH